VDFLKIDVNDHQPAVASIKDYDLVMDGTTISLNDRSTACIAAAGVHGINLNGCGAEWEFDRQFSDNGKVCVPGMGMTPGITNLMTKHAADQLETVDTIRISHGAFRPVAFSPAIAETTRVEYDPDLSSRVVYEKGKFIQVPPFARPREIELPPPFGTHTQYIIPHAETMTLPKSLADKQIQLIEVRGTWPPQNMVLIRTLYDWGFMRNDKIEVDGTQVMPSPAIFCSPRRGRLPIFTVTRCTWRSPAVVRGKSTGISSPIPIRPRTARSKDGKSYVLIHAVWVSP
jgi:saccharopine dehydrogenase-like NADP-dependent oxidoreductase